MRARAVSLALLASGLAIGPSADAHGTRSLSVDVSETTPGHAVMRLRTTFPDDGTARAEFDSPCRSAPADEAGHAVTLVDCPGALAGARITVRGLGPILSEAILVVALHDGRRISRVLTEADPAYTLPADQAGLALARGYVRLGVAHILTGWDHLLFLLAVVLLLRRPRAVLAAETAFTLSHSLSFCATALGWIRVSAPAAEAAIALSLVLVALDIGRPESGEAARSDGNSPLQARIVGSTAGRGAAMAFAFGLVHGLGFAGGLAEVGLPDHDVAMALLGFAGGIEVGQVAFLAGVLLALHVARRPLARLRFAPAAALFIGGISSYWLIQRTVVLLSLRP